MSIELALLCLATSAAAGVIVGMVVASATAARVVKAWLPDLPEFIAVQTINVNSSVSIGDDEHNSRLQSTFQYPLISARIVEDWLERRDLVMSPKGKDFVPAAKKGAS